MFQQLSAEFELPSHWKKLSMSQSNQELCFVTFNLNSKPVPTIQKCLKIDENNHLTFAVNGKLVQLNKHGFHITPGNNRNQFLENLKICEDIKLCNGGPIAKMFPNFSKNLCAITSEGLLQHHECFLIINKVSKATCCTNCSRLKNVLMCRKRRNMLNSKEMLEVSPSKKQKIVEIRQKTYSLQRKVFRTKKKISLLQEELIKSHNDMAECNNQFLEDKLKGMNDSQRTLILECFSASKLKNSKSRRYSENLLMLCLLLNIRSPSTYNYLGTSALLPLPH